jgi:hypothetical protein
MELHNRQRSMSSAHRGFRSTTRSRDWYMSQHFGRCHLQRSDACFHDQHHNLYFDSRHSTRGRGRSSRLQCSSDTATFTPSNPLALSTLYTATITTGAESLGGDPLASNYVWTFTTAAAACQATVPLGSACSFGALGGSTVTNRGTVQRDRRCWRVVRELRSPDFRREQ